jgi:Cytidylate kinase
VKKSIYPKILKEIKMRDKKDTTRKNSPLVIPKGAYKINNNGSFVETTNQINNLIKNLKS